MANAAPCARHRSRIGDGPPASSSDRRKDAVQFRQRSVDAPPSSSRRPGGNSPLSSSRVRPIHRDHVRSLRKTPRHARPVNQPRRLAGEAERCSRAGRPLGLGRGVPAQTRAGGGATLSRRGPATRNLLLAEYDGGRHAGIVATLSGEVLKGLEPGVCSDCPSPISA